MSSQRSWKEWATGLRSACSRRKKLVLRTGENESSSLPLEAIWPTPSTIEPNGPPRPSRAATGRTTEYLGRTAAMWPTPTQKDFAQSARHTTTAPGSHTGTTLTDAIRSHDQEFQPQNWPTPDAAVFNAQQTVEAYKARKARELEKGYNGNDGGTTLGIAAKLWATPTTPTGGNESTQSKSRRPKPGPTGDGTGENLQTEAALWATPRATEYKDSGPFGSKSFHHRLDRHYLDAQSYQHSHQLETTTPDGPPSSPSPPKLNPLFVEWLMGLPFGLTRFEPWETESYLYRQRTLLRSCLLRFSAVMNGADD